MKQWITNKLVLTVAITACIGVRLSPAQSEPSDRFTIVANKVLAAINASDYEVVTQNFAPAMAALSPDKAKAFFDGLKAKLGKIQSVEAPRIVQPNQASLLTHFERGVLDRKQTLNDQNKLAGFGFVPAEASPFPTRETPGGQPEQKSKTIPPDAATLFREGKFLEADKACESILSRQPDDHEATLLRGRIALLSNRLEDAGNWLAKAKQLRPEDTKLNALLSETYYRRDQFAKTAAMERALGKEDRARQLESFQGLIPYQVDSRLNETHVKFIYTDPLPLVAVRVNNGEEVNFLIDTGGGEVILDTDFAQRVGAEIFGQQMGLFGGGKQAAVWLGRVNSVTLGDFEIKNVPVHVLRTPFSEAAHGKRVDGIIGTVLLYHFIATIDYPKGELVLRKRTPENLRKVEVSAQSDGQIEIPFWMASDHFMVTGGTAGNSRPALLFADTGAAGMGFVGTKSFLEEAGIAAEGKEQEGTGGGGTMKFTTFTVNDLSLGPAHQRDVAASYGQFPPTLEYSMGFRIAGIISHAFFRAYALTLDFDGMRMFLKKQQESPHAEDRFVHMANTIVDEINSSNYEALTQNFNKNMLTGFPLEKVKAFFDSLKSKQGKIKSLEAPRIVSGNEALFIAHFEHADFDMKIALDDQDKLAGLAFSPPETKAGAGPAKETRMNAMHLRLPFHGRWMVMNGGDTLELNAHHYAPNQVAAFDFVGVGAEGKEFSGDGKRNEDYYAFGREVLAPGDGVVTVVITGVPDNAVGSQNTYSALGNAVFIEHGNGEVSVLAHFKLGSTRVKVGDHVKAGDVLGLCGNSGGSSKPHLHYHLQDTSVIQDGKGIKVFFQDAALVHDGAVEHKQKYSPVKGDILSSAGKGQF